MAWVLSGPRCSVGLPETCALLFAIRFADDYTPLEALEVPRAVADEMYGDRGVHWTHGLIAQPNVRSIEGSQLSLATLTLPVAETERRVALGAVTALDFERARTFIEAVPKGRWTAYKDVAGAGGNPRGAQAIGDWLRRRGDDVPHVHRVLSVQGAVADSFRPAGPGVASDSAAARALLEQEGVAIDSRGRASQHQCFTHEDWPA